MQGGCRCRAGVNLRGKRVGLPLKIFRHNHTGQDSVQASGADTLQLAVQIHGALFTVVGRYERSLHLNPRHILYPNRLPDTKRNQFCIMPTVRTVEYDCLCVILSRLEMHNQRVFSLAYAVRYIDIRTAKHSLMRGNLFAVEVEIRHVAYTVKCKADSISVALIGKGAAKIPVLFAVSIRLHHVFA